MYRVYCDGLLLYHSKLENLKIFNPSLELELNKTGSFNFKIYSDHPYYNMIKKLKSVITVYQDDYLLFRGRVLDDEIGWHNEKQVVCEGDKAFLIDSIQRPYDFTGSITDFLSMLITNHNAQVEQEKRFTLGKVTVTDANDTIVRSDIEYVNTWEVITQKLVNVLGGYIIVRHEDGINYLDYLKEITLLAPQTIQFGKNLLDLKRVRKGESIASAVIPLGAKLENSDARLTIASVNNGLDYVVDEEAKAQYGFIVKTVIFDDVTIASNLLTKGKAHLAELVKLLESIELSAADLATVDKSITSFHLGTQVRVISVPHGLNQLFIVSKLSINLLNPAANKLVLGKTISTFSESIVFKKGEPGKQGVPGKDGANGKDGVNGKDGKDAAVQSLTAPSDTSFLWLDISVDPPLLKRYDPEAAAWVIVNDTTEIVYNLEQNFKSDIIQTEENIQMMVSEGIYLKDETDALISEATSKWEQTALGFEMQFTQFSADLEAVATGADAEFEEIRKYIRFVDGKILLGEVGNELELQIANDRINFLQDGAEVAYFSNRKLYVTDTEILHSLQLGNFAFMPRANGNLSFKRIN